MVSDLSALLEFKIMFYFVGILIGWFAFYFLIDALKKVESFTKKGTGWKLIYVSLPLLVVSPIAHIHSYYIVGGVLTGAEQAAASAVFMLSGIVLFAAMYNFKRHMKVKISMPLAMGAAFFVLLIYNFALIMKIGDFYAFSTSVFGSLGLFFLALSLWIVGSYTKEFRSIFPMPEFLISASLILLIGQIVHIYAFAVHYTEPALFATFDFAGNIFIFIAFLIAAISTYVFKKTVLEFEINIAKKKGGE